MANNLLLALRRKIQVGRSQLGLDDLEYRKLLMDSAAVKSSKSLNLEKCELVLKAMYSAGFVSTSKGVWVGAKRHGNKPDQDNILRKLWHDLHKANKITDPSIKSMRCWIKRQTGMDLGHTVRQKQKCIESLKQWLKR